MFEARIKTGLILKNVLFAVKDVFPNIKLYCNSEGLSMYGMDLSHTIVFRLRFLTEAFDNYRCDRDINFGLMTSSFSKILKYVSNEDMITIRYDDRRADKIDVIVEHITEVEWTQYEIKLIDYDLNELELNPEEEVKSATIRMPSSKLQRISHDLIQVGDRITIACRKQEVRFGARGEMCTGCIYVFPTVYTEEPHLEVSIDTKEPVSQTFRLKVLRQLTKSTPITPQVVLHLRTAGPLEVVYDINVGTIPVVSFRFYIASDVDIED